MEDLKEKSYSEITIEELKASAQKGDAIAQHNLAVCYERGDGVEQNDQEAFEWFTKAAVQGVARSQFELGDCFA